MNKKVKDSVSNATSTEQRICLTVRNVKFVFGDWIIIVDFLINVLLVGKNGPFILF